MAVENWLNFELEGERNALTEESQNRLKNSIKMIEMFKIKEEILTFPLFIFDLGNAQKAVDCLIKAKLER
jgi:hypothetical protein